MGASQFKSEYYNEYKEYLFNLGEDNSETRSFLLRNLERALREEVTDRQWQLMQMYYVDQKGMPEIADELEVNISTVSRTLKRGRGRLRRCLRYGARELLTA